MRLAKKEATMILGMKCHGTMSPGVKPTMSSSVNKGSVSVVESSCEAANCDSDIGIRRRNVCRDPSAGQTSE